MEKNVAIESKDAIDRFLTRFHGSAANLIQECMRVNGADAEKIEAVPNNMRVFVGTAWFNEDTRPNAVKVHMGAVCGNYDYVINCTEHGGVQITDGLDKANMRTIVDQDADGYPNIFALNHNDLARNKPIECNPHDEMMEHVAAVMRTNTKHIGERAKEILTAVMIADGVDPAEAKRSFENAIIRMGRSCYTNRFCTSIDVHANNHSMHIADGGFYIQKNTLSVGDQTIVKYKWSDINDIEAIDIDELISNIGNN